MSAEINIATKLNDLLDRVSNLKVASSLTFNARGQAHANAVAQRDQQETAMTDDEEDHEEQREPDEPREPEKPRPAPSVWSVSGPHWTDYRSNGRSRR